MNKLLITIILSLMVLPLVIAIPPVKQIIGSNSLQLSPSLFTNTPLNTSREIYIHVFNTTTGQPLYNLASTNCYLHIYDEIRGSHKIINATPINENDYDFMFWTPASTYASKGEYSIKIQCNQSIVGGFYESTFYVTKSGQPPADDFTTIFIYLVFIISILGTLYTFFLGLAKLATAQTTIYDVLISWGFFVLLIFSNYLGAEYLLRTYVEDLTAFMITITAWTNGVLPLISFIISLFVRSTQKKKPLSVREIAGGGLS